MANITGKDRFLPGLFDLTQDINGGLPLQVIGQWVGSAQDQATALALLAPHSGASPSRRGRHPIVTGQLLSRWSPVAIFRALFEPEVVHAACQSAEHDRYLPPH